MRVSSGHSHIVFSSMPAKTPYPPAYRGEADLWNVLLDLDDGFLHFWHSVTPAGGTEVDLLLLDLSSGGYCLEIKALTLNSIKHLDLQTLEREDGSIGPSPFLQALHAARALGGTLDRAWHERPYLVPVAVFPLITRRDWELRFEDGPVAEAGPRCILKDDLRDLATFRARLEIIAAQPVNGRPRHPGARMPNADDVARMQRILFGDSGARQAVSIVRAADGGGSDAIRVLDDVIKLLAGPGAAYDSPGLDSLRKWRAAISETNTRLRASVIGEFKAGKSTLINAILGRDVCFVDEFEATTINALYTDGAPEGAQVEFVDEHSEDWNINMFLERCAAKQTGGIRRVTVTLPTGLPFDIVDSPGLGTITRDNEETAEEEIRRTNMLIWAVDCTEAGGAREGGFIQRAREVGLPILVLLTKSDVLSEGEHTLLIDYVAHETGIPAGEILPVSAHRHRETGDPGLKELLDRLLAMSLRHPDFAVAARDAKLREIIDGSIEVLRNLLELNYPHAKFVAAERAYLETSAQDISTAAKHEWVKILTRECSASIDSEALYRAETPEAVKMLLHAQLPIAIERATSSFMDGLQRLVSDEWRSALQSQGKDFEKRIKALLESSPDSKADLAFLESEAGAFYRRAEIVDEQSEFATNDSRFWVAGMGAVISLAVGSFIPLAIAGIVAGFLMRDRRPLTLNSERLPESVRAQITDALVGSFDSIRADVDMAIDRIVAEVAYRSLDQLVSERGGPDIQTILSIEQKANELIDELPMVRP